MAFFGILRLCVAVPFAAWLCTMALPCEAAKRSKQKPAADPWSIEEGEKAHKAEEAEDDPEFRSFSITANPLTLLFQRVGLNFEYMPAVHHGIMVNPFAFGGSSNSRYSGGIFRYSGIELTYHYYVGTAGADGFYFGTTVAYYNRPAEWAGETGTSSFWLGVDLGSQYVQADGVTVGWGIGIMRPIQDQNDFDSDEFPVIPRLLLTVGYSF